MQQEGEDGGHGERKERGCNYSQLLHFSEEQGSAKINKTYCSRPVSTGRCGRKHTV